MNFAWPGRKNLALCDPGDRLELASGPPATNAIVTAAQRVGQVLRKRHASGRGVVLLERGNRNTFYMGWRVRPVLSALLPGVMLSQDLADWKLPEISCWSGSSVPRLVSKPEHCYTLTMAAGATPASNSDLLRITITDVPPGAATDRSPAEAARPITITLRKLARCQ